MPRIASPAVTERTPRAAPADANSREDRWLSPGGIPVSFRIAPPPAPPPEGPAAADPLDLWLHLEHARLSLLRGFDQLLCLEGVSGVEHLPHQIETVRKVLRHFRGRVLLADEVGLGKTIEACLLLREYLLRGLARRVLILVPAPLVSQWREELESKFHLEFSVAGRSAEADRAEYWNRTDRILSSLAFAKSRKRAPLVAAAPWDLVIVDEAHHCKNRATKNWQLINSLKRRHMFLLTATPVQNNLLELYNLLTLLEPGHLKTEADFKRQYVRRGNPRDPRNRDRLRSLLGEVMVRNTRSLVQMDLPPRYAQTILAQPGEQEQRLYSRLNAFLRKRGSRLAEAAPPESEQASEHGGWKMEDREAGTHPQPDSPSSILDPPSSPSRVGCAHHSEMRGGHSGEPGGGHSGGHSGEPGGGHSGGPGGGHSPPYSPAATVAEPPPSGLSRMQLSALLSARGSHPAALAGSLERAAAVDHEARELLELARSIPRSAKDDKLLELVGQTQHERSDGGHKLLVFVNFRRTLARLEALLGETGVPFSTFSGEQSQREKDEAVAAFRERVPVMLCTESGGEGRNLQFADTLVNYDLPWNPMRIEQRVGRVHRIGQTREVFVFNLCTAGSLEARILRLLNEKIRMFELVVGEVGSILGNLEDGEEFESLVLGMWMRSRDEQELDRSFDALGESLLDAQQKYLDARELDEALFGEDYE